MRISDWSSDVCSSDLRHRVPILLCGPRVAEATAALAGLGFNVEDGGETLGAASATKMLRSIMIKGVEALFLECVAAASHFGATERSEERRGGKECVGRCRFRWSPYH